MLGNPVVSPIVRLLDERGPKGPSAIARALGRRVPRVSGHLATLRGVDLVRYDRRGGATRYRLKHGPATKKILAALAAFVREAALPGISAASVLREFPKSCRLQMAPLRRERDPPHGAVCH